MAILTHSRCQKIYINAQSRHGYLIAQLFYLTVQYKSNYRFALNSRPSATSMASLRSLENRTVNDAMSFLLPFAIGALSICSMVIMRLIISYRSKLSYPPGPPEKRWLSGHLFMLPLKQPWKVYTEWMRKYGEFYTAFMEY